MAYVNLMNGSNGATIPTTDSWVNERGALYTNVAAAEGSTSAVSVSGASPSHSIGFYNNNASLPTTGYLRAYYGLTAYNGTAKLHLMGNATYFIGLQIDNNGCMYHNDWGGTLRTIGSNGDVPLGGWVRIEGRFNSSGVEYRVFKGANVNGSTPDVTRQYLADTSWAFDSTTVTPWVGVQRDDLTALVGTSGSPAPQYIDAIALHSTAEGWPGSAVPAITGAAASTITLTGTAAAGRVPIASAAGTLTATGAAVAGKVQTAAGAPSISLAGSADASVITTHWAEAVGTITVGSTNASTSTKGMAAAGVLTAGDVAIAGTNTAADGVVQALGSAKARIDGETTPGFLYGRVIKTTITS